MIKTTSTFFYLNFNSINFFAGYFLNSLFDSYENLWARTIYKRSFFSRMLGRKFSDKLTRLVYSDFTEFRQTHSLHLPLFFFSRSYESWRLKHANPEGFAALSDRTRKGTRSLRSLHFFFIFFCFFFCNSMLSVRIRVSRLWLSSTSHYVRAKKISREFHTSFSHSASSSATFFLSFFLFLFVFSGIASTLRSLSELNRQERSMLADYIAGRNYLRSQVSKCYVKSLVYICL